MVEYSFEEAITLLTKNLENCKTNLSNIESDLDFLKDQITTTEVSILHFYYYLFLLTLEDLPAPLCLSLTLAFKTLPVFSITMSSSGGLKGLSKPAAEKKFLPFYC